MNHKVIAIAVIAAAAAIAGAYNLGKQQGAGEAPATVAPPKQVSAPAAPAPQAAAPSAAVAAAHQGQGHEGKVGFDPSERFTHFRVGNKNVKSIYADDGVMWIGTSGGVVRYDLGTDEFKLFDVSTGLLSNGMFYVGRIQGKLTVGTYGGGMSMLDEKTGTWDHYNIPEGLGDAFVYDVIETRDGDVWIATWSGVNRVKGGKLRDRSQWELHTVESTGGGLPNDWVYGLAEGKNGEIWLATEGGMARFENGKWENWNHSRGIGAPYEKVRDDIAFKDDPGKASQHHAQQKRDMGLQDVDQAYNPNYIVSLEVDDDGTVWAGTWGGGLAHYVNGQWENTTTKEGLPGNHIFMLHRDRQNRLWIGTNNGLALKQGDSYKIMKTEDGLFSNAVFSMATTKDGSMWVGSYGGVAHIRGNQIN
ncbi:MAG: regulator [Rhodocyclaceae bacterium]|nr:regulator [Rhodocyclaceae bacterium]